MTDRVSANPGRFLLRRADGTEEYVTLTRADNPVTEGTLLNKAAFLPDDLAQSLCPGVIDPTPADALGAMATRVDRIMIGSDVTAHAQYADNANSAQGAKYATNAGTAGTADYATKAGTVENINGEPAFKFLRVYTYDADAGKLVIAYNG